MAGVPNIVAAGLGILAEFLSAGLTGALPPEKAKGAEGAADEALAFALAPKSKDTVFAGEKVEEGLLACGTPKAGKLCDVDWLEANGLLAGAEAPNVNEEATGGVGPDCC